MNQYPIVLAALLISLPPISLRAAAQLHAYGDNAVGQTAIPSSLSNTVAIAAGAFHSLALQADGTVVAWGQNDLGQTDVPPGLGGYNRITAVAAGWGFSLALIENRQIAAWGWKGITNSLPSNVDIKAIAAGWEHALALKLDSTVVAWGGFSYNQLNVPAGLSNVVAIAGGGYHSLALKQDGTVTLWGDNRSHQLDKPNDLTNIVAIAGGGFHSLALRRNGTVAAWGTNDFGQITVPAGLTNVVAIAAGQYHSLALKRDGTVVGWGRTTYGQLTWPAGLNDAGAIAGGIAHTLILTGARVKILQTLIDQATPGDTITLEPTTYYGTTVIDKDVTLCGTNGSLTLLDGNRLGSVLSIRSNAVVTMKDLTVTHGYSPLNYNYNPGWIVGNGGGIFNEGSLHLLRSTIRNCYLEAGYGGGIYNAGNMEIENCFVLDCGIATWCPCFFNGGGIYNAGTASMKTSTIMRGSAKFGGGIMNVGSFFLQNSLVEECECQDLDASVGGGILNGGSMVVDRCMITNCSAHWDGGGIANWDSLSKIYVTNTTIADSWARHGGGFYGSGILVGCAIVGNRGYEGGGGLIVGEYGSESESLTLINCTVSGNHDYWFTGGILNLANAFLKNCTVVSNDVDPVYYRGELGSQPINLENSIVGDYQDVGGTLISQGYNLIRDTTRMSITGVLTGNRRDVDPHLGPLQDNGGLTVTHALLPNSPAVDAGACGVVATDQRGVSRPFDVPGVNDGSDGCDIGAFELITQDPPFDPPFITVEPTSTSVALGNSVAFSVAAIGSPTLTYQWRLNGNDLVNSPGISGVTSAQLSLALVQAAQAGRYSVVVRNGIGMVVSADAVLSIAATVDATHTVQGYSAGATNIVACQFNYPVDRQLLSLLWRPVLPTGWILVGASGDGNPQVAFGEILIAGSLANNPLRFSYFLRSTGAQTGPVAIGGTAEYQLSGMVNPVEVSASPNPLLINPLHTADYRDPRLVIDGSEANRVLSYWRAQSYCVDATGLDGYAPGPGSSEGRRHSADYRGAFWQIDGSEVNRVLSYWRAGCYHADVTGLDGYAPGCASIAPAASLRAGATLAANGDSNSVQSAALVYRPGTSLAVTNRLQYEGSLLSLLLHPSLPNGWELLSVSGDGNPEIGAGDIVWTSGEMPRSPVIAIYTVAVPEGTKGAQRIQSEAECHFVGETNPQTRQLSPDPLVLYWEPQLSLQLGAEQLTLSWDGVGTNFVVTAADNLNPPIDWQTLTETPMTSGGRVVVTVDRARAARFYRLQMQLP